MTDHRDGLGSLFLLKHMHIKPLSTSSYVPHKAKNNSTTGSLAHSRVLELNFHEALSLSCSVHHFSRSALYVRDKDHRIVHRD